jgi:hypothetical protein
MLLDAERFPEAWPGRQRFIDSIRSQVEAVCDDIDAACEQSPPETTGRATGSRFDLASMQAVTAVLQ